MPELPEVETIVRTHRPLIVGRRITGFRSWWPRNCEPNAAAIRRRLIGRGIRDLRRRAKYIVFDFDSPGTLLIHLRMSGRLQWSDAPQRRPRHARAVLEFDGGGRLWLIDARKFGRISFVEDPAAATSHLGVEPLGRSLTTRRLAELLAGRRRRIKPVLLDQSLVAGLGNIYADEALHRARIHPLSRAADLSADDIRRLCAAIKAVLRKGIRQNGASIDWAYPGGTMQDHLLVYGRTGRPCRRCRTPIVSMRVAQRGTHVCPRCQPNPADA